MAGTKGKLLKALMEEKAKERATLRAAVRVLDSYSLIAYIEVKSAKIR